MDKQVHTFKQLIVWQKSMDLVIDIYDAINKFPKEELYGLSSQIKICAISIPSNIAEGRRRTKEDFCRFLAIAYGSGGELETQLEIAYRLKFIGDNQYKSLVSSLDEIMRMLNVIISKLKS